MNYKNNLPVEWFYYITSVDNLKSILEHGILSYKRAGKLKHVSYAMEDVQSIRQNKNFMAGVSIHDCANLYLNPKNTTLFKLIMDGRLSKLVILAVSTDVMQGNKAVFFSSMNAACKEAKFYDKSLALMFLKWDIILGDTWNSDDQEEKRIKKRIMCAEVLVRDNVAPEYIKKIFVPGQRTLDRLRQMKVVLPIEINKDMFFHTDVISLEY